MQQTARLQFTSAPGPALRTNLCSRAFFDLSPEKSGLCSNLYKDLCFFKEKSMPAYHLACKYYHVNSLLRCRISELSRITVVTTRTIPCSVPDRGGTTDEGSDLDADIHFSTTHLGFRGMQVVLVKNSISSRFP